MIHKEAENQAAQREMRYLKDFLGRVERAPDDPNKELSILGIYRRMDRIWDELDEHYGTRLAGLDKAA